MCFYWEQVERGTGNLSSVIYCVDAKASSSGEMKNLDDLCVTY